MRKQDQSLIILQPEQVEPQCQGPSSFPALCDRMFPESSHLDCTRSFSPSNSVISLINSQYLLDLLKFDLIYIYLIGFRLLLQ